MRLIAGYVAYGEPGLRRVKHAALVKEHRNAGGERLSLRDGFALHSNAVYTYA